MERENTQMIANGSYISHTISRVNSVQDVDSVKFWYSRRSVVAFIVALFLVVQGLSYLIPPFQSPDEFYHLKRAYLLSEGTVALDKKDGVSGGYIDTGLLEYMSRFKNDRWFRYLPSSPASDAKLSLAEDVHWTSDVVFSDVPNVAVYFPLPYIPQAMAFKLGKLMGMTVASSYYLARSFSLIASLAILCAACFLYPVSPLVAALYLMPMTLFQLGSASLDAVSFSTVVLAGALYMRAASKELTFTPGMLVLFTLCLFSLATTRVNLIVLTILPCVLHSVRRSYRYLVASATAALLSLSWTAFSLATVSGGHGNSPEQRSQIVEHYSHHVGSFFAVVYDTLTNGTLVQFYWKMFVGVFGWSGIKIVDGGTIQQWGVLLHPVVYMVYAFLLISMASVTFQWSRSCSLSRPALWLLLATLSSAFLILPILLATWTPQPAKFIYGIQGRYFIPTTILLSFVLPTVHFSRLRATISYGILALSASISVLATAPTLLAAWWVD